MKRTFIIIILLSFSEWGFAQDIKQPAPPVEPARPVVPGAAAKNEFPKFPAFPAIPSRDNQSDGQVYEVEKYNLTISGAYTNGNTSNNAANTISNAQYTLYSNKTVTLRLLFTDGSEYIYHLRNPIAKIETNTGVFRETFDATVQAGRSFLLEQYSSELYYNNDTIISFHLIQNNRVIVQLICSKKTG